ncbi:energy transducer TonB [Hymenobacter yonginensis]|uniref:TonB family protein n=1 Tax=Hymenobacter yonginensis TaxID=748197 RepID=A0ABY7PTB2_9BACT|nr:energy transducer TonB [Hymenobacter yonginensis]WBO86155.1 TonB family protein [Hymenobacter yonginensis]
MKRILFALWLTGSSAAYAQQAPAGPAPATTVEYYSEDGEKLPSAQNAHHRVETIRRDSLGGIVREFYPSGSLLGVLFFADLKKRQLHGTCTTWYENGKPHTREDYVAGKRHGELLVYYPDGKLRRRDQFVEGRRTAGECFDADGQPVAYFEYEQLPVYRGGQDALLSFIAHNVRYPGTALRNKVQGKVQVGFVLSAKGEIENVRVIQSLSPETDAEAMRVVRQLRSFQPGRKDGQPVRVSYTVPINFALK